MGDLAVQLDLCTQADLERALRTQRGASPHVIDLLLREGHCEPEGYAVTEIEHLVQHHVAQAFDAGDTVTEFADDPDVLLDDRGPGAGDLCFDFLYQVGHRFTSPPIDSLKTATRAQPGCP